jgi:hypothetical protein
MGEKSEFLVFVGAAPPQTPHIQQLSFKAE